MNGQTEKRTDKTSGWTIKQIFYLPQSKYSYTELGKQKKGRRGRGWPLIFGHVPLCSQGCQVKCPSPLVLLSLIIVSVEAEKGQEHAQLLAMLLLSSKQKCSVRLKHNKSIFSAGELTTLSRPPSQLGRGHLLPRDATNSFWTKNEQNRKV